MSKVQVSIIIPTYNNQKTIALCLESIKQQTYEDIETVVVDGGSNDLTKSICRQYGVKLFETDLGMAAARLEGARHATGEFLFHVDSDMELSPFVVKECVEQMEIYDSLIIPETNIGDSYWAQCTDIGKTISRKTKTGNLRFLSRDLYFRVGGHNPELLGKEDEEFHDLVVSTDASIGHTRHLIRHHVGNIGLLDILSQRWRYIRSLTAYDEHARVDTSKPSSKPRKSRTRVLLEEARERPQLMIGYFILQISTGFLSKINQVFR